MNREKDPIHLLLPMLPKLCRLSIKKSVLLSPLWLRPCHASSASSAATPAGLQIHMLCPRPPLCAWLWSSEGDNAVQCVVLASLISGRTDWGIGRGGLSQCRLLSWRWLLLVPVCRLLSEVNNSM